MSAKQKCLALVDEARIKLKSPIIVVSTLRTYPEQARLYAKGRTAPGSVVTNSKPGYSWHNFGLAFDVAFLTQGKITWAGPWEELGKLGEELGLVWGGKFKDPDAGHFEYQHVLRGGVEVGVTLAELRTEYADLLVRTGGEKEVQWHS